MPKNTTKPGLRAARAAAVPAPRASSAETNRLSLPHVAGVVAFPVLGSALAMTGMPTSEICRLLAYCGGIGVVVLIAASGGRRVVAGLATLLLRASQ